MLIRATSFCRLTKSFISGGTTRRTACGSTTGAHRLAGRQAERPSRRALRLVDALDPGPEHLGDVGRVGHDEGDRAPDDELAVPLAGLQQAGHAEAEQR